ncbi:MAG: 2-isopropylmalate synthase, partial [Polyangiales bacterium]
MAIHDETLRDGVQAPSVLDPPISVKIEMLHLLDELGVSSACIGMPSAGPRAFDDSVRLAKEIADEGLSIRPVCAGRTVARDLNAVVRVSQRVGLPIEFTGFIGSSPIRWLVEHWSFRNILHHTTSVIEYAVREGLPVTYVTEDTTRSSPEVLDSLFRAAIDHGASRLCLCDTVGHATPHGVRNLVRFTRRLIEQSGREVGIDWHGHNDRGLALANTLAAHDAGVDRLHGCVLGIGERVGNAPLELLLLNLHEAGERTLERPEALSRLCRLAADEMRAPAHGLDPLLEELTQLDAPPASEASLEREALGGVEGGA